MTWIVVAREREVGLVSIGAFLVDLWCLGVKDAYAEEVTRAEMDALLDEQIPAAEREAIEPACAKKLIEGAVAYAQSFGFLPHREFRKARKVLNGIEAAACLREYTFGSDGQPRFVVGPDDDDARVNRVVAVLTAKLGPEGFIVEEFEDEAAADDDDDGVDWDALDMMFRYVESTHCPDRSLSGFVVSGFVAAAVTVDPSREPDEWWGELFAGRELDLPEDDQFSPEGILDGFLELWMDSEQRMAGGAYTPSLPPLDEPDHFSAAAQFCRGFLRVMDARPEAVTHLGRDSAAAEALRSVRRLAELPAEGPATSGRRDSAPVIAAALLAMWLATAALRSGGA